MQLKKVYIMPFSNNNSELDILALQELGDNVFIFPVVQSLGRAGDLSNVQQVALAMALRDSIDLLLDDDSTTFYEVLHDAYSGSQVSCYGFELTVEPIADYKQVLENALLLKNDKPSKNLQKLVTDLKVIAYPCKRGEMDKNRRYGQSARNTSHLYMEAKRALENTFYTVDVQSLEDINQALTLGSTPWEVKQMEARKKACEYYLNACAHLVKEGNEPRNSEFSGDWRGRLNQRNCHGPNGQAGDTLRSLMLLDGVSKKYSAKKARKALELEILDMIGGDGSDFQILKNACAIYRKLGAAQLIANAWLEKPFEHNGQKVKFKNPCSYCQTIRVYLQLREHIKNGASKPYIGIALGLDAKGSGVQISALMKGYAPLLAATGFSEKVVDDVYHLVNVAFKNKGLPELARDHVKKCFLGVLYGQGPLAYANPNNYTARNVGAFDKDKKSSQKMDAEIFDYICNNLCGGKAYVMKDWLDKEGNPVFDDKGNIKQYREYDSAVLEKASKEFHAIILSTFGTVASLMKEIVSYHKRWDKDLGQYEYLTDRFKHVSYPLPDGYTVRYKNKMKYNIYQDNKTGEVIDEALEMHLRDIAAQQGLIGISSLQSFEINGKDFHMMQFETLEVDRVYQSRTAFVNFIQSIDALLARLIIANYADLGGEHVIGIHDCFRVDICTFTDGLLHEAIALSYNQLFGDIECKWFPKKELITGVNNKDLTSLYFAGVQNAFEDRDNAFLNNGTRKRTPSAMFINNKRVRQKVNNQTMQYWVDNLENNIEDTGFSYFFCK